MTIKTRQELIKAYIDFFKKKGHKEIPSSSLIPENDPTVLFTTAGMHPLVPFLLGQKHPLGKRIVDVQKCVRTTDIDEVGDEVHHTFFEMLGNWSLGDYFKKEAIEYSFEFLTDVLKIGKEKIAVSCFAGDENAPRDDESAQAWKALGIKKIKFLGKKDNWWGPAGETGPCGPDTEMFVDGVEIWNDVFMKYNKTREGYEKLKQKNVDTGMGVERTLALLNGLKDNYMTEVWKPIIEKIENISGKKYGKNKEETKAMRIVADHVKASVFILGDVRAIKPGNAGQGYILRRLIRRAVRYGRIIGINKSFTSQVAAAVLPIYSNYNELKENSKFIYENLDEEEKRFGDNLESGLGEFEKISKGKKILSGKEAFLLYQSHGFPIEITQEIASERGIEVDVKGYENEFKNHQKLSGAAIVTGSFKSGLADNSDAVRKLHTATHLLNEALRRVLGESVKQKGSNITPERLRFDFNFERKLTAVEIKEIEALVNEKINARFSVVSEEMSLKDALKSGAQAEFGAKYPSRVSVYTIIDNRDKKGWFSKEICTGPHVSNTGDIGKFKIIKEESVAAGVRRIKAVVES